MAKVLLDNISNDTLACWVKDHFYYLPEAVSKEAPKGYAKKWAITLLELRGLLESRGFVVEMSIKPKLID